MQAIREIHIVESSTLTLNIPAEFLGQQLEVIMLPMQPAETVSDLETEVFSPGKRRHPSLLQVLAAMDDCDEEFPDVDEGLSPLDDVRFSA
ncbi:MAG: AbrB/MazE/SpoVT family DNA-binding domain-containing protein [Gammaproteobacteria bacterium]|nr:AbrB/MazE/SpoVT family DNA-binding domain-containing protein [Gammaproteobacteria bacterium]